MHHSILAPSTSAVGFRWQRTKVDSAEGMATLDAMSSFRKNRSRLGPAIAAPDDDHALVEADERFQAALAQAIAAGGERKEAVEATVSLKKRRCSKHS